MLPTEAFAEVVGFLRLFDLSALVVTNSMCSSLGIKASTFIRWEEFPGLRFLVRDGAIKVLRSLADEDGERWWHTVALLIFANENDTTDFIAAAFPNCIFEKVDILSMDILDGVGRVADSIIVTEYLGFSTTRICSDDVLSFVRKFRRVKVSFLVM